MPKTETKQTRQKLSPACEGMRQSPGGLRTPLIVGLGYINSVVVTKDNVPLLLMLRVYWFCDALYYFTTLCLGQKRDGIVHSSG